MLDSPFFKIGNPRDSTTVKVIFFGGANFLRKVIVFLNKTDKKAFIISTN